MVSFDVSFNLISIKELVVGNSHNDKVVFKVLSYFVYGILSIIFIMFIIALVQKVKYKVTIFFMGVTQAGVFIWDFWSDILFSNELYYVAQRNNWNDYYIVLFVGCILFLIVPIVISIIALFKHQDKWKNDPAIGDRVTGWNRDWSSYLLLLSMFCGSTFAAVSLLNSRVFGHPVFCMGLNTRHLKKFQNQRLWAAILAEDLPQLIIQLLYLSISESEVSTVLILAISSSCFSIVFAMIDIYNNQRLSGRFSLTNDYQSVFRVPVISHELLNFGWKINLATERLKEPLSTIIQIDPNAIEVDLPTPNQNGLVINFVCRTVQKSPREILNHLLKAQKSGLFAKEIQKAWQLKMTPLMGRINLVQIGRMQTDLHLDLNKNIMVNPLNADGIKIESDIIEENMDTDVNSRRGSTFKAKPYENVSKMVKANISRMKRESIQQDRSKQIMGVEMTETVNINRDIPENVHIRSSEVKSLLPQQPTGAHTKKMIDMEMNGIPIINKSNEITKKVSKNPISDQGQIIKHMIGNDPQTQFRKHIQEHGISPSSPELYGWRDSNNIHQIGMQQQFQQQAQSNYNQYGGYAVSAINLNQNNNYNNYQTNYKHVQNRYNNDIMTDDTDHIGFIPPAPQNEINKYLEYKQKRQARDEEKKLRKQWLTSYNMDNNSGIQFTPNIGSNIQSETDKIEKVVN
eukprot:297626_1